MVVPLLADGVDFFLADGAHTQGRLFLADGAGNGRLFLADGAFVLLCILAPSAKKKVDILHRAVGMAHGPKVDFFLADGRLLKKKSTL